MKAMKRLLTIVLAITLWTCDEKEPGPDLSGTISFKLTNDSFSGYYYIVISDTSGNVLRWSPLNTDETLELPYPPGNSKLANVSVLYEEGSTDNIANAQVTTFTHIEEGSYSIGQTSPSPPIPNGNVRATIDMSGPLTNALIHLSGKRILTGYVLDQDSLYNEFGVYNGETNDLYLGIGVEPGYSTERYVYFPSVKAGQNFRITADDYETATPVPVHPISYAEREEMINVQGFLEGVNEDLHTPLSNGVWDHDDELVF